MYLRVGYKSHDIHSIKIQIHSQNRGQISLADSATVLATSKSTVKK